MSASDRIPISSQHNFLPYIDNQNQESKISPTVAKQIAKSEKKLLIKDDELLFTSVTNTRWIVSDHMRLHAIDGLLTRILDYHNNIHQRVIYNKSLISSSNNIKNTDNVAYYISTSSLKSAYGEHFQIIKQSDTNINLVKIKENIQSKGLHWIHVLDLCILNDIIKEFNLDPLCAASFIDMRYHSCLLPTMNGCFISLCYFQLDESSLQMHLFKLFFYTSSNGLVITFVSELMPDVKGQQFVSMNKLKDDFSSRDSDGNMSYIMEDTVSSSIDIVCNIVIDRWETSLKSIAKYELGAFFIFYELANEILKVQDPVIEFLSRTIFFFKTKTSFRLTYRRKIQYMKRSHIVSQALLMLESNTKDIQQVILELKLISERNHHANHSILSELVISKSSISGIYDLHNNYNFVYNTIQCKSQELKIVNDAMLTISDVRADNTALVLSLIATIFLPATFLTGVFGMNFTENGGYTIELVNNKYGPLVFGLFCLGIAVFFGLYYLYLGWIEPSYSVRVFFKFFFGKKMMNYFLGYDIEEDDFSITPIDTTAFTNYNISIASTNSLEMALPQTSLEMNMKSSNSTSSTIKNPLAGITTTNSIDQSAAEGTSTRESIASNIVIKKHQHQLPKISEQHRRGSMDHIGSVSTSTKNRVIDALEEDIYRKTEAKNMRRITQQVGTNQVRVLPSNYRS